MHRIGFGTDSHKFLEGIPLILGGVVIPYDKGLASYTDGDVVIHSLIDAILGAAGLGDIGEHFPDDNPEFKDKPSFKLLEKTLEKIADQWQVINVDVTIVAQKPSLKLYKDLIKNELNKFFKLESGRINIKATTTEGMGFEGREEGITAYSICLLDSLKT